MPHTPHIADIEGRKALEKQKKEKVKEQPEEKEVKNKNLYSGGILKKKK